MLKFIKAKCLSVFAVLAAAIFFGLVAVAPSLAVPSGGQAASQRNDVKKVQKELQDQGYYHGKIDGLAGPETRAGIRQYQRAEHLTANGDLDSATAAKLGVSPMRARHAHTQPVEKGNLKAAEKSMGRGGKQFGHAMKKGKPVVAGKDLGKSIGHASKEVGKAAKKAVTTH